MFKSTQPISTTRSTRQDVGRGVTTGKAGKDIPVRFIPVLREEAARGSVMVSLELAETVRPLINAVWGTAEVWYVPYPAFPRYAGIDDFNRSYTKQPDPKTGQVEPFIVAQAYSANPIWTKMGVHMPAGAQVNVAPIEAYNVIQNHKRNVRSPNLPERTWYQNDLAPCFWMRNKFAAVVPNYDRSALDALVPVNAGSTAHVKGIGLQAQSSATTGTMRESAPVGGVLSSAVTGWKDAGATATMNAGDARFMIRQDPLNTSNPLITVDLAGAQMNIPLANIDLARKTAAFEALRKRYEGHDDEYIIELLMEGIRVPEYLERQPMLLASKATQFSFGTRFATDGANLDQSVTNGMAQLSLSYALPRMNTGGIIMVIANCVPDQLFERRRDPFLSITDQDMWPKYERDTLDLDKVDQVLNVDVDTSHATPAGIFGYEPMNEKWRNRDFVRLGGDLYRPSSATTWSEDRAVLWVTEPVNPTITTDWYLATNVNADPFADRVKDHLTLTTIHQTSLDTSTVFGPPLLEVPMA